MRPTLIAAALLLTGCGGGEDPNATLPPPTNAPPKAASQDGAKPDKAVAKAPPPKVPSAPKPRNTRPAMPTAPIRPPASDVSTAPPPGLEVVSGFLEEGSNLRVAGRDTRADLKFFATKVAAPDEVYVAKEPPEFEAAVRLPPGFTPLPDAGVNADGLPAAIRSEKDGREMVLVPGGAFTFGDAERTGGQATVTLSPFYMDRYEVTVAEYRRFLEDATSARVTREVSGPEDHPVTGVRLRDAQLYAEWAGKQVPTEAQWEKAARGPLSLPEVWGTGRPLWHAPRTPGELHPVGEYPGDRSPVGAMDLAGNAREWTQTPFLPDPYAEADGQTDWNGPRRPPRGAGRVVRGEADGWSVLARGEADAADRNPLIGFRTVLPVGSTGQ